MTEWRRALPFRVASAMCKRKIYNILSEIIDFYVKVKDDFASREAAIRALYTITELTREFAVTTRTLRFYEQEGLIDPVRRGRTRLYRPADRTRLNLILRGRRLGFSLAEIREIVDMYDAPPGERGQLKHLIARIADKRAELEAKRRDIEQTLAELDEVEAGCRERLSALGEGLR